MTPEIAVRVGVAVVLLVGLLVVWRRAATGRSAGRVGPALRVVSRTGLTRSSLVAVVEVDDQRFLVGAGEQGVQLLADLRPATAQQPVPASVPAPVERGATPLGVRDDVRPRPGPAARPVHAARPAGTIADAVYSTSAAASTSTSAHGPGASHTSDEPRIGPLDRLRARTVRSHLGEPIRASQSERA